MRTLALALILIIPLVAHAGGRPKWTSSSPRADATYKYYVGRALDEVTEGDGWRVAKDQAQEEAVRENFGVETSIAASSYESAKEVALDKRVSELFPKVRLVDFEQIDGYVEERSGRFSVWVMFRYPIKQAEAERDRLKTEVPTPTQAFNEVGKPELAYSTAVEITSEPLGIPVFIDSERWGVTPLRVSGVLPTGVHKLKLSHGNYQDVESDMVLVKGFAKKVHHRMSPAVGYLKVSADPDDAQVIIEGVRRGEVPVGPISIGVGKPKRIEVKREGFETQIQIIEVKKDETRQVQFSLNPIKRKPVAIETPPYSNDLTVEPDDESTAYRRAWVWGLYGGYSGASAPKKYGLATAQLGGSVEKRFWRFFGLRAGGSYDVATEDTETSKNTNQIALSGWGAFAGLPIYLTQQNAGFYVMPEMGTIHHRRIKEQTSLTADPEFLDITAQRKGVRLGYMNRPLHIDLWVAVHEYDWREWGKVQTASTGIAFTFGNGGR